MFLPNQTRIFVASSPADFRKGFDGLSGLVRDVLGEDPVSGALFVFTNRRRDQVKVLWADRRGMSILMKRLDSGTFRVPAAAGGGGGPHSAVTAAELSVILSGVEVTGGHIREKAA